MKAVFSLNKYFRNAYRRVQPFVGRLHPRNQGFAYSHLLSSLFFGAFVIKSNHILFCSESELSENEGEKLIKSSLLFIRNKDYDDQELNDFINSLKARGIEVTEIDPEANSDYAALLRSPKEPTFVATNEDGDVLEISTTDEHAKLKLLTFFRSVHVIEKINLHKFNEAVERLKDHERITFTYIPEQKDYQLGPFNKHDTYNKEKIKDLEALRKKYKAVKNSHLSYASTFYIIKDPQVAQTFNIGLDDVGEIYTLKKSSIYNNFETNTRISGHRTQISRIELSDEELSSSAGNVNSQNKNFEKKLYQNCLDYVNYFQTQNEFDNVKGILQQIGIQKIFIYYRSNNDESFSKIVTKLTKVKKDLKRDDICILATNNLGILKKQFQMTHSGFTNAFRFIDFSKSYQWQPPENYTFQFISPEHLDRRELLHDIEKQGDKINSKLQAPFKSSFEEKPTRKRIKNYLLNALDGKSEFCFESTPKVPLYFSRNVVGKRFENDVMDTNSDVLVEFFKYSCPSCAALSEAYEKFAKIVLKIKESIDLAEEKSFGDTRYEYDLVHKYKIQNPEKFKRLRVCRYDIYNESPIFPSPAATPLLFLFRRNEKAKPLLIDLVEDKVNLTDHEKVIRHLIRVIDQN